jgi:hypothetical protein
VNAPARFDTAPAFGAITTRQLPDGWFEAECQLSRLHPVQLGSGKTMERALEMLERRLGYWRTA